MTCNFCPASIRKSYRSRSKWVTAGHLAVFYACHKLKCRNALRRWARRRCEL